MPTLLCIICGSEEPKYVGGKESEPQSSPDEYGELSSVGIASGELRRNEVAQHRNEVIPLNARELSIDEVNDA